MVDEFLALLTSCGGEKVHFRGDHYTAVDVAMAPTPAQRPRRDASGDDSLGAYAAAGVTWVLRQAFTMHDVRRLIERGPQSCNGGP